MTPDELNAEYAEGRNKAREVYGKTILRQPPNPHKDVKSDVWRFWNRGWLAGCDEVLERMRREGKCIDV
jgi:hypothetical protein